MEKAAGIGISKRMVTMYNLALAASLDGTRKGARLARRFKRHFTEYAALSTRYLALVKQMAELRIHPDKLTHRYETLDAAFDKLQDEELFPLYEELTSYSLGARRPDASRSAK